MTHWTVDAPTALEFDEVTELNVRLIGGTVAVLASGDRQSSPGGARLSGTGGSRPPYPPGRTPRCPRRPGPIVKTATLSGPAHADKSCVVSPSDEGNWRLRGTAGHDFLAAAQHRLVPVA